MVKLDLCQRNGLPWLMHAWVEPTDADPLQDECSRCGVKRWKPALDIATHTHRAGSVAEVTHTHAWASVHHTHGTQANCYRDECFGFERHNIHPAPGEWSQHGDSTTAPA